MSIREDSKKIIRHMLGTAIKRGSLNDQFFIRYDELTKELDLESESYCRVCMQYLDGTGCIRIIRNDNNARLTQLLPKGIDFLETT